MGVLTLIIGFVGDMLVRIRMNQEVMLYHIKEENWREAFDRQRSLRALDES
jgi:hypothetical protein